MKAKIKDKETVTYKCKANDVILQFHFYLDEPDKPDEIDEVWIQIEGETSWTIVGFHDLLEGLKKAREHAKKSLEKRVR